MRILTVSAHYPPNFISGGTLQPQRLARALAERGHRRRVYAGWLGDRPAGQAWDEVDETGLAVRWIASALDRVGRRAQLAQPGRVTDDFRAHLARRRARRGPLPLAAVTGRRTAAGGQGGRGPGGGDHARLLVGVRPPVPGRPGRCDRAALVVEAGVCPCQVDQRLAPPPGPGPGRPAGLGRPGAGPVGRPPCRCWRPTGWPPGAWPSTRTGCPTSWWPPWAVPRPRPADRDRGHRAGSVPVRRRGRPHEGRRRAGRGRGRAGPAAPRRVAAQRLRPRHRRDLGQSGLPADLPVEVVEPFAPDQLGRGAGRPRRAGAALGHARDPLPADPRGAGRRVGGGVHRHPRPRGGGARRPQRPDRPRRRTGGPGRGPGPAGGRSGAAGPAAPRGRRPVGGRARWPTRSTGWSRRFARLLAPAETAATTGRTGVSPAVHHVVFVCGHRRGAAALPGAAAGRGPGRAGRDQPGLALPPPRPAGRRPRPTWWCSTGCRPRCRCWS